MYRIVALFTLVLSLGCATTGSTGGQAVAGLNTQLKVTAGAGKLHAKLEFANTSGHEIVVGGLDPRNFRVETVDGKPMAFKGKGGAAEPLHVPAGQTVETMFNIQDNYPFWDRRTKYKIWYESPDVRTAPAQFWF